MRLSQESIRRMTEGRGGVGGGGSSLDPSSLAGYATQQWVNENYLSIGFFSKLFKAYDSASTPNEVLPNDTESTITNIKAMFGFWTDQYLSALGKNNSGGGGGATALTDLVDVAISSPTNGQVLKYNSSTGKWYNGNDEGVSSVSWSNVTNKPTTIEGYGITDAKIQNGTITLGSNSITPLTSDSSISGNAGSATKLQTARSLWGNSFDGTEDVTGNITVTGVADNHNMVGIQGSTYYLQLAIGSGNTNRGLFEGKSDINKWLLYFDASNTILNYGNVGIGNTSPSHKLDVTGDARITTDLTVGSSIKTNRLYLYKPNASNDTNAVYLEYESANSGIHLVGGGLYADTYLSALGLSSSGSGSVSSLYDLLDVSIPATMTSSNNGQGLVYDSSANKWKNSTLLTALSYNNNILSMTVSGVTKTVEIQAGVSGDYLPKTGGEMTGNIIGKNGSHLLVRYRTDDSNVVSGLEWQNTSGTTISNIMAWNTGKCIMLSPNNATDPWNDQAGKYTFIVGENKLTYNSYSIWHSGNDGAGSGLDADLLDGYHAANIYNAPTKSINQGNAAVDYIRIATIVIPGGSLAVAGFAAMMMSREVTERNSFILNLSIRRTNKDSISYDFVITPIGTVMPRDAYITKEHTENSDETCDTFYVYIGKASGNYAPYYKLCPLHSDGNVTFETATASGSSSAIESRVVVATAAVGGIASKLATSGSYTAWGRTYWSNGVPQSINGNISYTGSKSTDEMIKFIDNTNDVNGNGIAIGGGGLVAIGGGESSLVLAAQASGGDERMIIGNDGGIEFYSNLQGGWTNRKTMTFDAYGNLNIGATDAAYHITMGSGSSYVWFDCRNASDTVANAFQLYPDYTNFSKPIKTNRLYLYKPNASNDTNAVYLEYESANSGIHLVGGGLYADTYISALGLNSGGGGGGATALTDLVDVAISSPTNGQVLKYNSSTGKWYNGNDEGVSSISWSNVTNTPTTISGYGITDAKIQNGTITLGSNSITPLTSSSISDMATKTWVNDQHFVDYVGETDVDFNFTDGHDLGGGVYQLHTRKTQTNKPMDYGILVDFESVNGHLQFAAGTNDIRVRSYWWTNNPDWSAYPVWKTIAFTDSNITGNAGSATKLQTARTLWGNSFDGTQNLTGDITIGTSSSASKLIVYGAQVTDDRKGIFLRASDNTNRAYFTWNGNVASSDYLNIHTAFGNICLTPAYNVGIGTSSPSYKLHVNGEAMVANSIYTNGHLIMHAGSTGIYLNSSGTGIDWHNSSNQYVSSLLAFTQTRVHVSASGGLRIGDGLLVWDSTNKAIKVQRISGNDVVAGDLYATGGISALGMSAGVTSLDEMTFGYLTVNSNLRVNNTLTFGNNYASIYMDDFLYIDSNSNVSVNGVECENSNAHVNRLYLDSSRYIYVSSGKLYYYNGSSAKEIAFTN